MSQPYRFPREAWAPLLAGLLWLWNSPGYGLVGFLFSVIPGCLLLGSGMSMLLIPGDRRIAQFEQVWSGIVENPSMANFSIIRF